MNMLVIGNGFDLALDLPTKYSDFLNFTLAFYDVINSCVPKDDSQLKRIINRAIKGKWKFSSNNSLIDKVQIEREKK